MKTKILSGLLAAALGLTAQAAHSASITVDGNDTATNCTLAEAIDSANGNADTGGCVGSGAYGADTITLATDVTLAAALPNIASAITIEGGGKTINGNNSLSVGSLLTVASGGNLTIKGLTMQNGNTTNVGGIPELVNSSTGFLVPSHDSIELASALDKALGRQWSAESIAAAARRSWPDVAGDTVTALESTLRHRIFGPPRGMPN